MLTEPTLEDARAVLLARFGYGAFRPGQERVIRNVLAGHAGRKTRRANKGKPKGENE